MSFEPIKKQRVAEQVANAIREAILSGRYNPGDPLPSERELASTFGVNRSGVREALHRLEAWDLIEIRQGGATLVRDFLVTASTQLLPFLVAPGGTPDLRILRDLQAMRVMLMGWMAREAARAPDAEELAALREIVTDLERTDVDAEWLRGRDFDFFDQLVAMIGNRVLALVMNAIRQVYLQHPELFVEIHEPGRFDPIHHQRLLAALEARDVVSAGRAMEEYAAVAEALLGVDHSSQQSPGAKTA